MFKKMNVMLIALVTSQMISSVQAEVTEGQKFKDWTGTCQKSQATDKRFCGVAQIVKDDKNTPMARLMFRKVEGTTALYIKVPLEVNIIANIGISIDGEPLAIVPYSFCDPEGCNAVMGLKPEIESVIKKGKSLTVGFYRVNEEFSFNASLSGVTSAIDSL